MAILKHIMCCIFYTFCAFKHVSFEAALLCNFWKVSNLLVVPLYRERKKPCIQQILNLQPLYHDVQECLSIRCTAWFLESKEKKTLSTQWDWNPWLLTTRLGLYRYGNNHLTTQLISPGLLRILVGLMLAAGFSASSLQESARSFEDGRVVVLVEVAAVPEHLVLQHQLDLGIRHRPDHLNCWFEKYSFEFFCRVFQFREMALLTCKYVWFDFF